MVRLPDLFVIIEQDLQSKYDHAIAGETILLPVGTYELSKHC